MLLTQTSVTAEVTAEVPDFNHTALASMLCNLPLRYRTTQAENMLIAASQNVTQRRATLFI